MTAAKNFDLIIRTCQKLNLTLKIFGTGIEENKLRKIAGKNVEFLGRVSDEELASLYQNAKTFIVAQADEDFGITPIEANAAGTPVIAFKGGGYLETVIDGQTGLFFDELTVDSLVKAIKQFEKSKFYTKILTAHAQAFSKENFQKQFRSYIKEACPKS